MLTKTMGFQTELKRQGDVGARPVRSSRSFAMPDASDANDVLQFGARAKAAAGRNNSGTGRRAPRPAAAPAPESPAETPQRSFWRRDPAKKGPGLLARAKTLRDSLYTPMPRWQKWLTMGGAVGLFASAASGIFTLVADPIGNASSWVFSGVYNKVSSVGTVTGGAETSFTDRVGSVAMASFAILGVTALVLAGIGMANSRRDKIIGNLKTSLEDLTKRAKAAGVQPTKAELAAVVQEVLGEVFSKTQIRQLLAVAEVYEAMMTDPKTVFGTEVPPERLAEIQQRIAQIVAAKLPPEGVDPPATTAKPAGGSRRRAAAGAGAPPARARRAAASAPAAATPVADAPKN